MLKYLWNNKHSILKQSHEKEIPLYFIYYCYCYFTNNRFAATCSGSYYWIKKFNTFQKYQKYTIMSLRTTIQQWLHKTIRYEPTVWMTSIGNSERKPYSIWEKCMKFRIQGAYVWLTDHQMRETVGLTVAAFSQSRKCLPNYGAKVTNWRERLTCLHDWESESLHPEGSKKWHKTVL